MYKRESLFASKTDKSKNTQARDRLPDTPPATLPPSLLDTVGV